MWHVTKAVARRNTTLLSNPGRLALLEFEKRDIMLVAASVLFTLGLWPFVGLAYAAAIGIMIYFGTKALVSWRRRQILSAAGSGICAQCGGGLEGRRCPNCDVSVGGTKDL